jgi:hypothetical protein
MRILRQSTKRRDDKCARSGDGVQVRVVGGWGSTSSGVTGARGKGRRRGLQAPAETAYQSPTIDIAAPQITNASLMHRPHSSIHTLHHATHRPRRIRRAVPTKSRSRFEIEK